MSMLLEMSLAGALLIIVIALVRALVMHKLPKVTFLVLWAIVLVRLLVPFSIPSQVSVFNLGNILNNRVNESHIPQIYETSPIRLPAFTPIWQPPAGSAIVDASPSDMATATVRPIGNPGRPAIQPMSLVYLVGVVLSTVFFAVLYFKHRVEFRTSLPVSNDFTVQWLARHKLRRRISIRVSDKISAPLTYGILRPVILLPKVTDWANHSQLKYILAHEYVHIRRFDTLTKLIMAVALCIHWFNPVLWAMYFLFNRDMEITCDEAVIKMFGETSKQSYALTLIGMVERRSYLPVMYNHFSKHAIEERIISIMKIKKATIIGTMLALALIVTTAAVFATTGMGYTHEPVVLASASGNPPASSQDYNGQAAPATSSQGASGQAVQTTSPYDSNSQFNIVVDDFLAGEPTANEITAEVAAQTGVTALEALFGGNLDGATIEMFFMARVEAGIGRGSDDGWSINVVNSWTDRLGMTPDEIFDYVRERSERDYTFEIGLNVDSLASQVGLTSDEFINAMHTAYITKRTVPVVEGWARELGVTKEYLFDNMGYPADGSVIIDAANTLGIPVEDFVFILGNVWNTTMTTWQRPERPAMWTGRYVPEGAMFDKFAFQVNAETGELMAASYTPWAVYTIGRPDTAFRIQDWNADVDVSATPYENYELANRAMDIAQEFNLLGAAITRARVSTILQMTNIVTEVPTLEFGVDVQCVNGNTVHIRFSGPLDGNLELQSVAISDAHFVDTSEFDWVAR